jgi:hypothetical protein
LQAACAAARRVDALGIDAVVLHGACNDLVGDGEVVDPERAGPGAIPAGILPIIPKRILLLQGMYSEAMKQGWPGNSISQLMIRAGEE